jgi:hypothetical protein
MRSPYKRLLRDLEFHDQRFTGMGSLEPTRYFLDNGNLRLSHSFYESLQ